MVGTSVHILHYHRLTMMQWSNLIKCGLFFNIVSLAVHTLLPLLLQCMNSCGIEVLILILKKSPQRQTWPHHWSDTASQPSVFSCWGTENSQMVPSQEIWRVINQFKGTVTHSSHCNHRLVCWSIVLVKQDSLRQLSRPSLVLLFKVLNYLSSVGLSGRKQCS